MVCTVSVLRWIQLGVMRRGVEVQDSDELHVAQIVPSTCSKFDPDIQIFSIYKKQCGDQ